MVFLILIYVIYDHCPKMTDSDQSDRWEIHQVSGDFYPLPLRIISVGMGYWPARAIVAREQCNIFGIELVTRGSMDFCQNRHDYNVKPGEVFLLRKGCTHYYRTGPENFVTKRYLTLEGAALEPILHANGLFESDYVPLSNPRHFTGLMRLAYRLLKKKPAEYYMQASQLAYQLLLELGRNRHPNYPPAIQQALDYMEKHLAANLTRADMAEAAGLSETHFNRLFNRYLHASPVAWFIQRKMALAQHYLTVTNLSIKEIAQATGFADPLYFSAQFKKYAGLSPKHYAQSQREKKT